MSPSDAVLVVSTGVANTASVCAALRRRGATPHITHDPAAVATARHVVLPGVGSFAAGQQALRDADLLGVLRERVAAGRPTLAVCLGMQLLLEGSDESPGVPGLGVVPGHLRRLPAPVRVPHLGWSPVHLPPTATTGPLSAGVACFAHSYALLEASGPVAAGWSVALAAHGVPFVAAFWRERVLACQFHPELSGTWGEELLQRWLSGDTVTTAVSATPEGMGHGIAYRRIVPCLDVQDGRVVKGIRFQGLRDAGDPVEQAARYTQDADELVILDVSATPGGRRTAVETVAAVRDVLTIPLTVGGGVRSVEDAARLLDAGADKVAVNSAAVESPALLTALAERFGVQCVVLSLDAARREGTAAAADGWEVVVRSGTTRTGRDALDWAREAVSRGAGEILLTSWDRDGTGGGYDLALLAAISAAVPVPVVASGGASSAASMHEAFTAGADAALAASIFHDGRLTVADVKATLAGQGAHVRPPAATCSPTDAAPITPRSTP